MSTDFLWRRFPQICLCLSVAVASVLICASSEAAPKKGNVVAVVVNIQGTLLVKTAGSIRFVPAKRGQFLYEGDIVKTDANSLAAITFATGVNLKINKNTEFTITPKQLGEAEEEINVKRGQVNSKVMRRGAVLGSAFGIRTTVALAAVRGTEFDVAVEPPKKKKIRVKIKKSALLEKDIEKIKKQIKEEYEKEAKAKAEAKKAEQEVAQKKKEAEEAAKKAEKEKKEAIKKGTIEEVKEAEEAEKKAKQAKKEAEESEAKKKAEEERAKLAEQEAKKAEEEAKSLEAEKKKAEKSGEEVLQEKEAVVQEQRVSVFEGMVELGNEFGKINVQAGQFAMVTQGEAPQPPEEMKPEDKPKWQEQVKEDKKEETKIVEKLKEATTVYIAVPAETEEKTLELELETKEGKKKIQLKLKKEK